MAVQRAITAMAIGRASCTNGSVISSACISDLNMAHSLTNPLNGGRAATESTPIRNTAERPGMVRASPPSLSMLPSPAARRTVPVPMSSNALKMVWLRRWKRAATRANVAGPEAP